MNVSVVSVVDTLTGLAQNLALLLSLTLLYSVIRPYLPRVPRPLRQVAAGVLFALIAIAAMHTPFIIAPGVIADARVIPVLLAGPFGGPGAALTAAVVAAARAAATGAGVLAPRCGARRDRPRVGGRASRSGPRPARPVRGGAAGRTVPAVRHARPRHAAGPREPPSRRARATGAHPVRHRARDRGPVLDRRRGPHRQRQRGRRAPHRLRARRAAHQAGVGARDQRLARALVSDLGGGARRPAPRGRAILPAPRRQRGAARDLRRLRRLRRPRVDQRLRARRHRAAAGGAGAGGAPRARAGAPRPGRGGERAQGPVPGHALARAAHAPDRDPRLRAHAACRDAAGGRGGPGAGRHR